MSIKYKIYSVNTYYLSHELIYYHSITITIVTITITITISIRVVASTCLGLFS